MSAAIDSSLAGPLEETITLQQAKRLIQCMAHEHSFLLLAPPGVGKSEMVYQAAQEDRLFTHHFNMLRTILEKTASFHGHKSFSACIRQQEDDPDGILHARLINILSHGNYSLFEPQQMLDENKGYFRRILRDFQAI